MPGTSLTVSQLSRLDQAAFTQHLAGIFEHSPWIPERAWRYRPFPTLDALHQRMVQVMRDAEHSEKRALIMAHPELAGKEARAGRLTPSSAREQRGAGLDQCSPEELLRLNTLNARYKERFGFPFIIAVSGRNRKQIMDAMETRLTHSTQDEFQTCLDEIARIARFRLDTLVAPDAADDPDPDLDPDPDPDPDPWEPA